MSYLHRITHYDEATKTGNCLSCGKVKVYVGTHSKTGHTFRTCKSRLNEKARQRKKVSSSVASGYLYLIKADNGLTKIGISNNTEQRFNQLQAASPCKLELLFTIEKSRVHSVEKFLHSKYKQFWSHGEWFNLSDYVIEEIINNFSTELV